MLFQWLNKTLKDIKCPKKPFLSKTFTLYHEVTVIKTAVEYFSEMD